MMDHHRHIQPRQEGAEKKRQVLQPPNEGAVKRAGQVVIQSLEILHKQERQHNHAGGALHQQGDPPLLQLAAHHVRPLSQPHTGKQAAPVQEPRQVPGSQHGFQGTHRQGFSHPLEDLLRGNALHVTEDNGRMALASHFQRLEFQRRALHPAADHGHVQLVGLGEAVLGPPLHHLVLRLLGAAVGKPLDAGNQPFLAAVHTQQDKAAHQQGEQLWELVFLF